jgi:hypothetical protein
MNIKSLLKRVTLLCCLVLTGYSHIAAQDRAIERIRRMYDEIGKKIELAEKGVEESTYSGIFSNELIINRNEHVWPAVGNFQVTYKFYYDSAGTEGHHYPGRLRKVVMKSRMSDRAYHSEYLFDESGALIFCYSKPVEPSTGDSPPPPETRVYFSNRRPIRIVIGDKTRERLTAQDLETARKSLATGAQIKAVFASTLALPVD